MAIRSMGTAVMDDYLEVIGELRMKSASQLRMSFQSGGIFCHYSSVPACQLASIIIAATSAVAATSTDSVVAQLDVVGIAISGPPT
jgi:hypothetical protein